MTGVWWIQLLWKFRFTAAIVLLLLIGAVGVKAYGWKSSQLAAEQVLSRSYQQERDQALKDREKQSVVLGEREARNAQLQIENSQLLQRLRGTLDTPQGRAWVATPLPTDLALRLSEVDTANDSGDVVGPDAPTDLRGDNERRPP